MLQDATPYAASIFYACERARDAAEEMNRLAKIWHLPELPSSSDGDLLWQLHRANFELWHLEDRARDRNAPDTAVAAVKRSIDVVNQRRNDLVESLDEILLQALQTGGLPRVTAPLHSETPGQMFDRLSILALKLFHTREESLRTEVPEQHRERNRTRLLLLVEQQGDLADCLSVLWQQVLQEERRFKQYRQLKMYNDPELNPVLYQSGVSRQSP